MFRLTTIPRIVSNVHYRTRRKTHPKRNWAGRHPDMEPLTSANTEGYVLTQRLLNESTGNACPPRNQIHCSASLDSTHRVLSGEQIRIVLHQVKNSFLFHFSLYHYIEASTVDPTNVKEVFGYHFNVV